MNARQKAKRYKRLYEESKQQHIRFVPHVVSSTENIEWLKFRAFVENYELWHYGKEAEQHAVFNLKRQIGDEVAKRAKVFRQEQVCKFGEGYSLCGNEYTAVVGFVTPPSWMGGGKEVDEW